MAMIFNGLGVSPGISIERAFVLPTIRDEHHELFEVRPANGEAEWQKLLHAVERSRDQIAQIKEQNRYLKKAEKAILDAHLTILQDPLMLNELQMLILAEQKPALSAVRQVMRHFELMFEQMEDAYLRERAHDVRDIGERLVRNLIGSSHELLPAEGSYILFAREISPSLTAQLDPRRVRAIVTTLGGKTSHVSIMARSLGIPYVLGVDEQLESLIGTDDLVAVDGERGLVCLRPDDQELQSLRSAKADWDAHRERLAAIREWKAETLDGHGVELMANLRSVSETGHALEQGADGVGLFRSEYMFMDRQVAPDEEEQLATYLQLVRTFGDRPVVIRTIDIGGDKDAPCLPLPKEENPFLGLRAIRFSLAYPELLRVQLRAVLRASAFGQVKLLLPMITSLDEVDEFKQLLDETMNELRREKIAFNERLPLGAMVEVPAAALIVDRLAEEFDFLSIGTNDLAQYTLAADRLNEKVTQVFNPYHPALLRLIAHICRMANDHGTPVSVCGEMASEVLATPLWLGLGVNELSMSASHLLSVKERILQWRASDCKIILEKALSCRTAQEVTDCLLAASDKPHEQREERTWS